MGVMKNEVLIKGFKAIWRFKKRIAIAILATTKLTGPTTKLKRYRGTRFLCCRRETSTWGCNVADDWPAHAAVEVILIWIISPSKLKQMEMIKKTQFNILECITKMPAKRLGRKICIKKIKRLRRQNLIGLLSLGREPYKTDKPLNITRSKDMKATSFDQAVLGFKSMLVQLTTSKKTPNWLDCLSGILRSQTVELPNLALTNLFHLGMF